ncbi:hypothetical protein NM688_g1414 [Phlebia brevispora]|uniref:Uncharacterized protein n=1 Tax=Phlebia brevispora TaxID=194682 RepID=A0ACC1TBK0_9APHY|nr:hypothetical protein NM688_g1414 [Phlebia brevispora]
MSSTTTSASPSSTSASPTDPANSPILSSQAALYLYTFLVTLILLLTVSAAIVLRTYFLRRRHRRLVEEAIRNGTYVPPIRTPRTLGARPRLHDAVLNFYDDDDETEEDSGKSHTTRWTDITPLAVWLSGGEGKPKPSQTPHPSPPSPSMSTERRLRWVHRRLRRALLLEDTSGVNVAQPIAPVSPSPSASDLPHTPQSISLATNLHVAVLISMPSPPEYKQKILQHQRQSVASASLPSAVVDLPAIEFGIATAPYTPHAPLENEIKDSQLVLTSSHSIS